MGIRYSTVTKDFRRGITKRTLLSNYADLLTFLMSNLKTLDDKDSSDDFIILRVSLEINRKEKE